MRYKRDRRLKRQERHDYVLFRKTNFGNSQDPIPHRVTLLRPDPSNPSRDQLFLDRLPIPRDAFHYDPHDRVLTWHGAFGGGHLHLCHDGSGGSGNIGSGHDPIAVMAGARAQFTCDVALNTGATYVTSGGKTVALQWDPASAAWTSATWIPARLQLTYTVTPGGPLSPPSFTFEFADEETGAPPWTPPYPAAFSAAVQLGSRSGELVWDLTFQSNIAPDPDDGKKPAGPDSVYPYWLQAVEDAAVASIDGVLVIDKPAPGGTLVGMKGVRSQPSITGYYRTSADAAPFGIFDGRLTIAARSSLRGNVLQWSGLAPEHQKRTGLPQNGTLTFNSDGSGAKSDNALRIRRLGSTEAIDAIGAHKDLHPELHARSQSLGTALSTTPLTITGLLSLTPFAQDAKGNWSDVVQQAVTTDLGQIMNSFIPSDMWSLLYPTTPQPTVSGELSIVANSPVPNVPDPTEFYRQLGVAVLTQGMAGGSDPNCQYLNAPRATQWLKTQTSVSPVYYKHSQMLFQYEWQQKWPITAEYIADQANNAGTYVPVINQWVASAVADIQANVVPDPSDPNLIPTMIADVQAAGQYAITNGLYWPFAYYVYNTSPAILANIALQYSIQTGSSDGSALWRIFQQVATVLTALDPSGFFNKRYTQTLNSFLATNILTTMFNFGDDASDIDIVKQYMQQMVTTYQNDTDPAIQQALSQIATMMADQQFDDILKQSILELRTIAAGTQLMSFVAQRYGDWFSENYPRFAGLSSAFGSVLIGGMAGLAMFNIVTDFEQWDHLTDLQKAVLITNATRLGIQILQGVAQRGVRIYAIWDELTGAQRAASVSKLLLSGELDSPALESGLLRIGNSAARWIGDTRGTTGVVAVIDEDIVNAILVNDASAAAADASWLSKILGNNLDEFIATRIGPVFVLAGIGFSIASIIEGDRSGMPLAIDILGIVSGSLMLFASVGGWALASVATVETIAVVTSVAAGLGVVAALAGIALMIYELVHQDSPPDPVKEFVDQHVTPAGFAVASRSSGIDYATTYANPDQNGLQMIGFTLASSGKYLQCNPDGSIGTGAATNLPNCVWIASTDALGMSIIRTIAQPDLTQPPATVALSLMNDGTISFQPSGPNVKTQKWLSAPQGGASLTSKNQLTSINLTFQPVLPDANGNYLPSQASGWLLMTSSGVVWDPNNSTTFTLSMSAMAPNYMTMRNLTFVLGSTPSTQEAYAPVFGIIPSTPMTYAIAGTVPPFLTFSTQVGTLMPNGQTASTALDTANTITANNVVGNAAAPFSIAVA